jgi:hypothetical protein
LTVRLGAGACAWLQVVRFDDFCISKATTSLTESERLSSRPDKDSTRTAGYSDRLRKLPRLPPLPHRSRLADALCD